MKTKLIIIALLTSVSIARATLIDLTPGGFNLTGPPVPQVEQFFRNFNFGMENLAGFNVVNGQIQWSTFTRFGPPQYGATLNANGTMATVDWNIFQSGFHNMFVFVESSDLIAHLYRVTGLTKFIGSGTIEIDGTIPIVGAVFAGTFNGNALVPDIGWTILLFGIGILTTLGFRAFAYGRAASPATRRPTFSR